MWGVPWGLQRAAGLFDPGNRHPITPAPQELSAFFGGPQLLSSLSGSQLWCLDWGGGEEWRIPRGSPGGRGHMHSSWGAVWAVGWMQGLGRGSGRRDRAGREGGGCGNVTDQRGAGRGDFQPRFLPALRSCSGALPATQACPPLPSPALPFPSEQSRPVTPAPGQLSQLKPSRSGSSFPHLMRGKPQDWNFPPHTPYPLSPDKYACFAQHSSCLGGV